MISSSSSLGGGTKHMFMLGKNLNKNFKIYYAMPQNKKFMHYLNKNNYVQIKERYISFLDIIRLNLFIKKNSIDIIHAHGKGAGAIARIAFLINKKPLIYTFHGIHLKCHNFLNRIFYILYENLLGYFDSIKILVSKSEEGYARKSKIFLGKDYLIINNGVRNRNNKNLEINHNFLNRINSKVKVISIGRFVSQKNINDIIKIAKKMPNLNFQIIGDGPLWQIINNSIKNLKINNVELLGEKNDVFKYLYKADIFLSTSLYEGLPISILEAMSIGLPIVASNVTGNLDTVVNGKSGYLYNLNDIDMAVNYLNKLAKDIKLRSKIGNYSFQRQRRFFSEELMIKKYINLYKGI